MNGLQDLKVMGKLLYKLAFSGCLAIVGSSLLFSCGGGNNAPSSQDVSEEVNDSVPAVTPNRAYEMYKLIPENELPKRCRNLELPMAPQADECLLSVWYSGDERERETGYSGLFSMASFYEDDITYVCYSARGGRDGLYESEGNGVFSYKNGQMQRLKVAFPQPGIMDFFEDKVNQLGVDYKTLEDVYKNYGAHYEYTFVTAGDESKGGVLVGLDLSYLTYGEDEAKAVLTPALFYEFKNGAFIRDADALLDEPMYILEPDGIGGEEGYGLGGQRHKDEESMMGYTIEKKGNIISYSKNGEKYFSAKVENDYVTEIDVFTRHFAMLEEYGDGNGVYAVGQFLDVPLENGFSGRKGADGKFHAEKCFKNHIVELVADDREAVASEVRLKFSSEALREVLSRRYPLSEIWNALPKDYRRDTTTAIACKRTFYKAGDGCELTMKDYDGKRYCYMMKCIPLEKKGEYEVYVAVYGWESQRANETLDEYNRMGDLKLEDVYCYDYSPKGVQPLSWNFDEELDMDIQTGCKVFHFDEGIERIRVSYQRKNRDGVYSTESSHFMWHRPMGKMVPCGPKYE